jgi:hypothetical protein
VESDSKEIGAYRRRKQGLHLKKQTSMKLSCSHACVTWRSEVVMDTCVSDDTVLGCDPVQIHLLGLAVTVTLAFRGLGFEFRPELQL